MIADPPIKRMQFAQAWRLLELEVVQRLFMSVLAWRVENTVQTEVQEEGTATVFCRAERPGIAAVELNLIRFCQLNSLWSIRRRDD